MCLKNRQISETLKKQRILRIQQDLPQDLSTETVDALGLDQGVNILQANGKNQGGQEPNQETG